MITRPSTARLAFAILAAGAALADLVALALVGTHTDAAAYDQTTNVSVSVATAN
jgi:hypothetical protein